MTRNSLIGLVVFGVAAAAAGYIWTAFEFPFVILVPAAIGWYAVVRTDFGHRTALWSALVGGASFTVAFLFATFLALTDGSPVALSAWMAAVVAAAVAGAATGYLLDRLHGAMTIAGFSAVGMLLATVAAGIIRSVAPAVVQTEGPAQYLYVAVLMGIVGVFVGTFAGAGTSWLAAHRGDHGAASTHSTAAHGS